MLSPDLLNILVCPVCKGELLVADGEQKLLCRSCGLVFPIRNGIPVMLADQAEILQ
jgi:hypothetical protein